VDPAASSCSAASVTRGSRAQRWMFSRFSPIHVSTASASLATSERRLAAARSTSAERTPEYTQAPRLDTSARLTEMAAG
jgi:hypothetical protein